MAGILPYPLTSKKELETQLSRALTSPTHAMRNPPPATASATDSLAQAEAPAPLDPPAPTTIIKKRSRKNAKPARHCIPKLAFRRLMREIVDDNKSDMRLQQGAVDALQEAAETLVTERFQKCSQLAELCHLDTVRSDHWNYVRDSETVTPVQ